jgi:phage FluMu protein Com
MEEENKFKCSRCGKTDRETKFYSYLKSKCAICKRWEVNKNKEVKDAEKVKEIEASEDTRELVIQILKNEQVYYSSSVVDFMTDMDTWQSFISTQITDYKCNTLNEIKALREELNTIKKQLQEVQGLLK